MVGLHVVNYKDICLMLSFDVRTYRHVFDRFHIKTSDHQLENIESHYCGLPSGDLSTTSTRDRAPATAPQAVHVGRLWVRSKFGEVLR